ncbi:methyltransferase family protein [Ilumatobacter fluminis]|uniref:Methyltransferase family protein n=1 Tax=Ilumatobacter fluminis TaxID=467091 RepID=A0A4R7HW53_9ACTN|nr:class I SAM-dependent methyltransferase [Ilumatobacter fluminis]TDT15050.1 methyltransferase family protein [Ilumatobacter fluminis]
MSPAQNIYDDDEFFAAYSGLLRQQIGLDGAPEWPTMRAMLPASLDGMRVLDLGCGYGWIARWAETAGAAEVVAVDVSEKMLSRAREFDDGGRIEYVLADVDAFEPTGSFDVVVSSLTLHYLTRLDAVLERLASSIRPGGRFVFSCEHPIYLAPAEPRFVKGDGFSEWPVSRYHVEGERRTEWLGASGVVKYHRKIDTYFRLLSGAGFTVTDLVEWGPSAADLEDHPEWTPELDRPMILLVGAQMGPVG